MDEPSAPTLIRELLANDDGRIRMQAIALLEKIGNLDDIGLLLDLLALPDSAPDERAALLAALQMLSRENHR
jgi:HEAT repeat protein